MRSFLGPAISLANSASFNVKLYATIGIFLIPFLGFAIKDILDSQTKAATHEQQLVGVELLKLIKPVVLDTAKHRGNMALFLNGATDKEPIIRALETKLDESIGKLVKAAKSTGHPTSGLEKLTSSWSAIKLDTLKSGTPAQSFAAHTKQIEDFHHETGLIVDRFALNAQETKHATYLEDLIAYTIPEIEEELGKLRGKASGALGDKQLTDMERIDIASIYANVIGRLDTCAQELEFLYSDNQPSGDLKQLTDQAASNVNAFLKLIHDEVMDKESPTVSGQQIFESGTKAIDSIVKADDALTNAFDTEMKNGRDSAMSNLRFVLVLAIITTLIGLYFSLGILYSLNENAQKLRSSSIKLQDGDLTTRFTIDSNDVLGQAGDALSSMANSVAKLVYQIQTSAQEVNDLSAKLQSASDTSRNEIDQQNSQTAQSASAATEMAATVRDVARSCVQVSTATDEARQSALIGQERVNDAIKRINVLGVDVERAQNIIGQLQNDVTDIGTVLEVIRSIAEQTNLLALNAAIEAARAGEQGRGFAVVADEVRSLAKRTADSTAEIRQVIERLQTRAVSAVEIIQHSYNSSQESVASAASAGDSLQNIVQGVEQLRDLNTQIATAAEQQAAVAEQMSRNTQALSDAAENILEQIDSTVTYSRSLRSSAMGLLENTLKFKTS